MQESGEYERWVLVLKHALDSLLFRLRLVDHSEAEDPERRVAGHGRIELGEEVAELLRAAALLRLGDLLCQLTHKQSLPLCDSQLGKFSVR